MKKDVLTIGKPLLIKALILSFVLLTLTFGLGLAIGKTDDSLQNITSADEGGVREQLSDCSFKLQEITAKHLSLISSAKKNGLMDKNGMIEKDIVCTVLNLDEKAPQKVEPVEVVEIIKELPDEARNAVEPEKEKIVETVKEPQPEKKVVEKKKEKPKKKKNCSFSIQLFSDPDKVKAQKAKKRYPFDDLRLVEAEIRGRSWYRIRYGCYASRAQAELDLPEVKDVVDSAIVVTD